MTRRSGQLSLPLPLPRSKGWGGRRRGAGRKPSPDPALPHASRERFVRLAVHVTLRTRSDVPSLRSAHIMREIERTFAAGGMRPGFRLLHYSLHESLAHFIVEAADHDALGRGMKAIGARLARAVNRAAERSGRVLADRYHHRILATPDQVQDTLRHVLVKAHDAKK